MTTNDSINQLPYMVDHKNTSHGMQSSDALHFHLSNLYTPLLHPNNDMLEEKIENYNFVLVLQRIESFVPLDTRTGQEYRIMSHHPSLGYFSTLDTLGMLCPVRNCAIVLSYICLVKNLGDNPDGNPLGNPPKKTKITPKFAYIHTQKI